MADDLSQALQGLDPDVAAQFLDLRQQAASPAKGAAVRSAKPNVPDPSAGGGQLSFGPWDTGIKTPQWLDRTLAGAGQGMTDLVRHAGNLVGLESDQALKDAAQLDAPLLNTTAGRVGQFIGQTAASAPLMMGVGGALGAAGNAAQGAKGILPLLARAGATPIGQGVVQGAAQGAVMADPGNRLQGTLAGGALGGMLPAAASGIGKLASGVTRTPAAQLLMDRMPPGTLTPGQMNPTGIANRMEQAMEGAMGVGDLVQNARSGAMQQFVRSKVEDAMAPGAKLTTTSSSFPDMIDEAARSFDTAYNAGKGFPVAAKIMNATGPDVPLSQAFKQVAAKPRLGLAASDRAEVGAQLNDQLQEIINAAKRQGGLQSDDLLSLRSMIRQAGRDESGDTHASRAMVGLWKDAEQKVTQALDSQLPPDASAAVKAADAQYAKFAIVRDVAKSTKDAPDGPTPFQFSQAIARATPANNYARGAGLGRDMTAAAREVFQNNVPRTGFAGAGRLLLPAAVMAPAAITHPFLTGPALAAMAGLTLTKTGRALAGGQTRAQQALQGGLMNLQNAIGPTAGDLMGLYGRDALVGGLLGPRLQQQAQ